MLPMQCVEYLSKAKESKMILQKTNVPDGRTGGDGENELAILISPDGGRTSHGTDGRTAVEE